MKISVIQPAYYAGDTPDEKIAAYLCQQMKKVSAGDLILLPEYSNAGGLSDREAILCAMSRAPLMLASASAAAKAKAAYVSINVLEQREGKLRNSTYLFLPDGTTGFVYDKIHLPPAEVQMGICGGNGACFCQIDDIRFGFMTCYDVYFNEQIEYLARQKPDLILVPGYQRGERVDIIRAQAKLLAFRCNAFVVRASYSMGSEEKGGCSMLVAPDGTVLQDMGSAVGTATEDVEVFQKYMRPAGFGQGLVRNDDFISSGCVPELFSRS